MKYVFGIYGFDFSKPMEISGVKFLPTLPFPESREQGARSDTFRLTGIGELPEGTENQELRCWLDSVRTITDGMTFCQRQSVIATRFFEIENEADSSPIPDELPLDRPRRKGVAGGLILNDAFSADSRASFIQQFLTRVQELREQDVDQGHPFLRAIYRLIELARLGSPFWEIKFFLAFTALEILAREYGSFPPRHRPVSDPIHEVLINNGFQITIEEVTEFTRARNSAFHRGEHLSETNGETINAIHLLHPLEILTADLCLKLLGFDDERINWNRWKDRMPFR